MAARYFNQSQIFDSNSLPSPQSAQMILDVFVDRSGNGDSLVQIGPLRAWPGGLCLSRTIGDIDAGQYIVPVPHVKQITVSDVITLVYRYNMHREGNFLVFDSDHESENFWASAFTWRRQAHHCLRWSVGSADLREGCQGVSWGEASGDCCKEHRQGVLNKY
jgi:hypothetical protein